MTTVTKPDMFLPLEEIVVNKEFEAELDRKWDD
jgi:hypothetical protein